MAALNFLSSASASLARDCAGRRAMWDHAERSSSPIAAISRSVATCGASSRPARSSSGIGGPYATRSCAEPAEPVGADDPRRNERDPGLERDPRRAGVRTRLVLLPHPLLPPRALREHDDDVPLAAELRGRLERRGVVLAAAHRERARGGRELLERRPEELRLGHEAQIALREERQSERPGVEVRVVVRGEHVRPVGEMLAAARPQPEEAVEQRPAERCDEDVDRARPGRHTRSIPMRS